MVIILTMMIAVVVVDSFGTNDNDDDAEVDIKGSLVGSSEEEGSITEGIVVTGTVVGKILGTTLEDCSLSVGFWVGVFPAGV